MTKNEQISATKKATKERRGGMVCRSYELKVDASHCNKNTIAHIQRVFLEAKWLRNDALNSGDVFTFSRDVKEVTVKVGDEFEERELIALSSQMKQSVIDQIRQDVLSLSAKKKKGLKVGALKFQTRCNSINLVQYDNTYRFKDGKLKIQGIKQLLRVHGLDQIFGVDKKTGKKKNYEFANAKLIQKASGYYVKVTCWIPKELINTKDKPQIGLDMGIATQIALSNGIEVKYNIAPPVKKMRRECRSFSRKESHSSAWYRQRKIVGKEYEKVSNKKADTKNKIVHILKNEFSVVCFQDEMIKAWQRIWGKRILNTAIGGITASLKKNSNIFNGFKNISFDKIMPTVPS